MGILKIRGYDYLVTGGAGFIGSHLCDALLSRGKSVLVLDDLSTGNLANLEKCVSDPGFSYTIGSVCDEPLVAEAVDLCSTVVHLAAAVGVETIIRHPVETIEVNVRGAENVLRAAAKKGRRTFIASTSEVYGKGEAVPFGEEGDLVFGATSRSRWSYACSKTIDEFLALAYAKSRGLPVTIGRLFNTVGPRQSGRYGMVLPRFIRQALAGEPVTVYGDGTQTRCFSLVYEVVECILALLDRPSSVGMAVNIGSTDEISILDLARIVREKTGSSSEIVIVPYDEAYPKDFEDMQRRVPDISRLMGLIGFSPQAGIGEIIDRILASEPPV